MDHEHTTERSDNQEASNGKSTARQYMWLISCPVERDDGKRVSQSTEKCRNPALPTFFSTKRSRDSQRWITPPIQPISSHSTAGNCTKSSSVSNPYRPSHRISVENIAYTSSRSETTRHQGKGRISDQSDSLRSVGFGALTSICHLESYVTGHGAHYKSVKMSWKAVYFWTDMLPAIFLSSKKEPPNRSFLWNICSKGIRVITYI